MNQFYDKARQRAAETGLGWTSGNIKALLVSAVYVPNIATDEFVSTIVSSGGILKRSGNFTSKTNVGGVLNADFVTFSLVAPAVVGKYVVIYRDTGVDATSELIIVDDTAQNLPYTSDGGNAVAQWSSGTNKIGQI